MVNSKHDTTPLRVNMNETLIPTQFRVEGEIGRRDECVQWDGCF
jgi:hypothetical protein